MQGRRLGVVDRYRDRLPVAPGTAAVTLNEGGTPLIELENLPRDIGTRCRILVKFEGLNPTGSFKDRGMTMAVTRAREEGSHAVMCASTGNTAASAAAYAARAGMVCFVVLPEGNVALGKIAQSVIHEATILQVRGNFDDGLRLVREVAEELPVTIVNSINPYRLQGQKTAAFEIVEELGVAPDYHCLPVGNAGNVTAHWIGYSELAGCQDPATAACAFCEGVCPFPNGASIGMRPRMIGYQAAGAAPFLRGEWISNPETRATAIRIGHPQSWDQAWAMSRESNGWFDECTDEEIFAMQKRLAMREGLFCEPASATSVAGAIRDIEQGKIEDGAVVVCTLTGNGLKDPSVVGEADLNLTSLEPKLSAVRDLMSARLEAAGD